ncbi:MAG: hypothetical protein PHF63_02175 [Herbinix sp.]|jgi:hypothetical protein|nr:hypothetical protein [Herbinix sp.]
MDKLEPIPSKETREAMEEVERMIKNPSAYKSYNSAEELIDDILKEIEAEKEIED